MHLNQKFNAGEFVILAEIEPPKGVDISDMVTNARRVKGKVDAFVLPEMSNAVMRMSSLGAALILQNRGMQTVVQANCRDRNRIALQADMLAASGAGIRHVMAVAGEDPSFGDHHQARAVNDIDMVDLIEAISGLNRGRDMAGIELKGATDFIIGSTANAGAVGKSVELEIEEMNHRQEAGATFFITPPVFHLPVLEPFMKKVDAQKTKIIPTVLLLKSVGMARYMARNMPHIRMPDELIDRIQKSPDKTAECIRLAADTVDAVRSSGYPGVHIATIGWENRLPDILERV